MAAELHRWHGNQCQLGASQASKLKPDGVVGPSIIAHTLCNIAAMCKEFRAASREGCKRPCRRSSSRAWTGKWEQVFSDPMACKADVLN